MSQSLQYKNLLLIVALAGALVLVSGCLSEREDASADMSGAEPVSVASAPVSQDELVTFVEAAFEYAHVHGQEAALREFNDPTGQFVDGELYIFAYDSEGNTLALPFQPEVLGTTRWNTTDVSGTPYIRDLITTAQSGGGFVRYLYADPSDDFIVKQKLSYVTMVGQDWLIGAGIYLPDTKSEMTASDLAAFVQDASAYVDSVGEETALDEFSKKDGQFSTDVAYIYAYDHNGTLLADPYSFDVGTNFMGWTDVRGLPLVRIFADTASRGGGFIAYLYPVKGDGIIDVKAKDTHQPVLGYVAPAGDNLWIVSDMYLTDIAGEGSDAVSKMVGLIESCAAYGYEHGSTTAFAEISNCSGMFVDAEGHYVYAYDYNGTLLAHPYLQESIGSSLIDRRDSFGMEMIWALTDTARSGGGYVVFMWPNPDKENREELKIGYVLPVDDTWWVGSGVYLSEITGMDASISS
ncbi:cache domain-containing protein [Methanolobus psychrotolerans]|uniref:cache domain-containing protein n=1 Tax=Methanolobus psychrotolerans TaxID=1874706 RepID=UPI000B91C0C8|nr:cache domain-containing protein [Methanolobus psychrotolerans]